MNPNDLEEDMTQIITGSARPQYDLVLIFTFWMFRKGSTPAIDNNLG